MHITLCKLISSSFDNNLRQSQLAPVFPSPGYAIVLKKLLHDFKFIEKFNLLDSGTNLVRQVLVSVPYIDGRGSNEAALYKSLLLRVEGETGVFAQKIAIVVTEILNHYLSESEGRKRN